MTFTSYQVNSNKLLLFDTTPRSRAAKTEKKGIKISVSLIPWAMIQTVWGLLPYGRQTSQASHLHHCVLANLKEYHCRPFPSSRLSATDRLYPGFPARLLRCDLFHSLDARISGVGISAPAAGVSQRPGYGYLNG